MSGDQPVGSAAAPPYGSAVHAGLTPPLPPGTVLQGRYRLARVLGAGAFGRVYLADDMQVSGAPPLAVKELLDAQFSSPEAKREAIGWFKREVSTLLTLDHPGVPAIHSYWTAQPMAGPFYLAMDYIPGQTLQAALGRGSDPLPWRRVVAWGLALCDVLAYLHSRTPPFVFRDLKPPNVMLDSRSDKPVLIDFGIARQLAATGGTAIGTWGYMPYEQILGKAEMGSDVYALGATLHALLTGRQPDEEYTRLQRSGHDVESALRALFPPADTLRPELPPTLAEAISQATAFASDDRFPTASAMAEALRQVLEHNPAGEQSNPDATAPPLPRVESATPTLVVSSGDSGAYSSIGAALRAAPAGARIEVRPGRYAESVVIGKAVEIVGIGPVDEITIEVSGASCLVMRAERALVRGLSLSAQDGPTEEAYYAVDIPMGNLVLEDCAITSAALACVAIHGATSRPELRRCRIHHGRTSGVLVYDHGTGVLEDCDIAHHALAGVEIAQGGDPTLRHCAIYNGAAGGVVVHAKGRGTLESCAIHDNALAGVEIREEGDPILRRCTIRDGKAGGVLVHGHGRGTLDDCAILGNALGGVEIARDGNPLLRRCTMHNGLQAGVAVYDQGQGVLEDCAISGNALAGIEISQGGNPLLRRCTIHDGKQSGVLVYDGGGGAMESCDIMGHPLAGVEIRERGNAVLRRCRVTRNGAVAIDVYDHGVATVEGCDLSGNAAGAWRIVAPSDVHQQGNAE